MTAFIHLRRRLFSAKALSDKGLAPFGGKRVRGGGGMIGLDFPADFVRVEAPADPSEPIHRHFIG
jgi:hypothetical protein